MTLVIDRNRQRDIRGRVACNATYEGAASFIANNGWDIVENYPPQSDQTGLPVGTYRADMTRGGYGGVRVSMAFAADGRVAVAAFASPRADEAGMRSLIGDFLRAAGAREIDAPHAVGNPLEYFRQAAAQGE